MPRWAQGVFYPKHPEKYVGKGRIIYRSGWELSLMNVFDTHPNVIQWASETIRIPYRNPFTGKNTFYVPDFFVMYVDKDGKNNAELIEVKPLKQTNIRYAKTKREIAAVGLNMAKWRAAQIFCKANNLTFRVLTEESLFRNSKKS